MSERLRTLRWQRGLPIHLLAQRAGVSAGELLMWEQHGVQPPRDIVPVILFGVTESAVGVVPALDFHDFGAWLDGNRIEVQLPVELEPLIMGYTSVQRIAPLRPYPIRWGVGASVSLCHISPP